MTLIFFIFDLLVIAQLLLYQSDHKATPDSSELSCVIDSSNSKLVTITKDSNTNLKNRALPFNYSLRTRH